MAPGAEDGLRLAIYCHAYTRSAGIFLFRGGHAEAASGVREKVSIIYCFICVEVFESFLSTSQVLPKYFLS